MNPWIVVLFTIALVAACALLSARFCALNSFF